MTKFLQSFILIISIHTPHAGSDGCWTYTVQEPAIDFNPHSPCGERRYSLKRLLPYLDFNPHSPCGERLVHQVKPGRCLRISIHTPHAGSDAYRQPSSHLSGYFNPHSPCGERRGQRANLGRCLRNFNPHSPCGERPVCFIVSLFVLLISIHTPHAGSDDRDQSRCDDRRDFNPHSPCGERRFRMIVRNLMTKISIHTPHAGSDADKPGICAIGIGFQSTLPMRGATQCAAF